MYLTFEDSPPRYCMRDLDDGMKSDVGIGSAKKAGAAGSLGKRVTTTPTAAPFTPSAYENDRDSAIKEYYQEKKRRSAVDEQGG